MSRSTARIPRPDQARALTDLATAFAAHDRVQLTMPCGTGKTLIARWHAQASGARRVLVLLPSLALLAQTLREWRSASGWPFRAHIVCSDPSTAQGAAERAHGNPDWSQDRVEVTTDPIKAARFLGQDPPAHHAQVVFSTYHSSPVLAAAMADAAGEFTFDLVVCDEAHRLAGGPSEDFQTVLNQRAIPARHRLFMTATPRTTGAEGYSMDDPRLFGVVAHAASFGDAIRDGLLVDYQVVVIGARETGPTPESLGEGKTTPAALMDAIDRHGLQRLLSFHSRVNAAAAFADLMDGTTTAAGTRIRARHLSGATPAVERARTLAWLGAPSPDGEVRIVTNARLLTEGVDVPAVDGLCFADPRSSVIDIIQAVGRVLRPSAGKVIGTIIVPITVADGLDDDTELTLSRFGMLWQVLRALRSHDQRFALEVDAAARGLVRHGHRGYRPTRVQFQLPEALDLDAIYVRLVTQLGDGWERLYAAHRSWSAEHPDRRMPRTAVHGDIPVGEWATKQREAYARGALTLERITRLEHLTGWYWNRAEATWQDTFVYLHDLAAARGTIADAQVGQSEFAGYYSQGYPRESLGLWLARQRQGYRDGTLDPRHAEQLEQLPGWSWTPVAREDLAYVDALHQFVEFEGHADVPDDHIEDGLALGRWCWKIRRAKLTGTLAPELEDEILAATPSRWASGARLRWQWEKPETQWRLAYVALRQYVAREGHAHPSNAVHEQLVDGPVALGQWVALQRHQHRIGELTAARQQLLEALPGWQWEGNNGGALPAQPPMQLPEHVKHGSAGASSRGCKCEPCQTYRRETGRAFIARRRQQRASRGIDPAGARRQLARLEAQLQATLSADRPGAQANAGRALISTTSGVPLSIVRQLAAGTLLAIDPEHRERLAATTAEMCLRNTGYGSRGRPVQLSAERVDGGPTRALVADLQSRGFDLGWIGRHIGLQSSLQIGQGSVTRHTAERVAQLHREVGDLVAPERIHAQSVPPLKQLRAQRVKGPAA